MKTLAELQAIRDKAREKMTVRDNNEEATRVVVGMATCGIAGRRPSGAERFCGRGGQAPSEQRHRHPDGLHRHVQLEPIVEVFVPGKEKVTYAKVSPEKVARIVADHLVNGNVVAEYTVGSLMK